MPLFGPDPKDELIELLKDERNYLRAKVADLEKQLLALHSGHAFRMVHGEEPPPRPTAPGSPDAYTLKTTTYEPGFSKTQVEASFNRGD